MKYASYFIIIIVIYILIGQLFSSNYKTKHSNNKSLEDKYFKNNNNDKIENYENHVIIHKF